jgi:myo-inositol-1(or 4)-monophosphatase
MLDALRKIGARLLQEARLDVSRDREAYYRQAALPRGAAGDRTFPLDRKAEEIILSGLESTGEPFSVVSEEAGLVELKGGGRTVLIDPIDGSRNAITGIPYYGTSIAVADGGRMKDVELSYVVNLVSGEEFWALKDGGAFLGGAPLQTQKDEKFYLVAYETQSPGRDVEKILPLLSAARRTRCLGAIALDLAYLASGGVSVFINPVPTRSFDFAGGFLLVMEAGGAFTDLEGGGLGDIELGLRRSSPLVASANAGLHEKALELLG